MTTLIIWKITSHNIRIAQIQIMKIIHFSPYDEYIIAVYCACNLQTSNLTYLGGTYDILNTRLVIQRIGRNLHNVIYISYLVLIFLPL